MNRQDIKTGTELTVWAVWLGALWFLAVFVAPALFHWLPHAEAGLVASRLFHVMSWYSLLSCVLLLGLSKLELKWIALGVIAVCALELLWLHPRMGQLRQAMSIAPLEQQLVLKPLFGTLHMVSSVLYAIKMVGGLAWGVCRYSARTIPARSC